MSEAPLSQAARIFRKFGGAPQLCKALAAVGADAARNVSAVYRWNLPKERGGSGGLIPTSAIGDVMRAARLEGIVITPDDLYPLASR
jgi:hypothetical protein